ncbi:DUF1553 domain-containing protein [Roseibacillus persicicus]|uniref:DUF1553 domain-containing protein n=1 Tax=Roseibacillus persicicus TaxID=454148 RepID=UPI00167A3F81|nr:DUF1553 domain-containing protein [Roseibacillus persicicus]
MFFALFSFHSQTRAKQLCKLWPLSLTLASPVGAEIDFSRDIQPLLSENCYFCHGTDPEHREADLRLDIRDDAIEAGAIVPGDPSKSEIVSRMRLAPDHEDLMPPKSSHRTLTDDQITLLENWIREGAEYSDHWAFTPLPEPTGRSIDEIVEHRLEERGLKLKPQADPHHLLRRLTLDLTGLPPTPEEIEAFDPNKVEEAIDRLLASPRFGEHMAVPWLDIARYADTYGFQQDLDRFVWPYRDYVIEAFNKNKPFDRFIHEQIAGDLLPDADHESRLATAFSRLHQQKVEGGSVEEEFRVEYIADRLQTYGTAFLGLTMECSRCHDHKYDPTTAKDYYSLFAFFDDIDEAGLYSYFNPEAVPTPALPLLTEEEKEKMAALEAAVRSAEEKVSALQSQSLAEAPGNPIQLPLPNELLHLTFDDPKTVGANSSVPGKNQNAIQLTGDDAFTTQVGDFSREQPFTVSTWIQTPDVKERAVIFSRSKAWTDAASRGYELLLIDNHLQWSLIHYWPGNAISVKTEQALEPNQWYHVTVTNDGSSKAAGLQVFIDGQAAETKIIRDQLTKEIKGGGNPHIHIGERMRDRGFKKGLVDDFRVFDRQLTTMEISALARTEAIALDHETQLARTPEYQTALSELQTSRAELYQAQNSVVEIMTMIELPEPKQAYILNRGEYSNRGEPVDPAFPAFLPSLGIEPPADKPLNRLDLAEWTTHPDNPLTSRVNVNRIWQSFFGRGLVGTPEDFGIQGEYPEYLELLNELSARFIQSGWDFKALVKEIVSSKVYQQASLASAAELESDPENQLLARGPRHRLSAEVIRDQALYSSGLLVEKLGGPPVKPYDLSESFKPNEPDTGEGLYRRSLYTYWRRTAPSPAMSAFDAGKRDVCAAKRDTTSTPLQALVLLNGTQFVEAARHLAETVFAEEPDFAEGVKKIFFTLTSRQPDETEVKILTQLYEEQLAHYRKHPDEAKSFLHQGQAKPREATPELAALTALTQALMNLHEVNIKS